MKYLLTIFIIGLVFLFGGDFEKGFSLYKKNRLLDAEKVWLKCAEKEKKDDLRCSYSLAVLYDEILSNKERSFFDNEKENRYKVFNYSLPELFEKATKYYKKVANAGYPIAYAPLGLLYYKGAYLLNVNVVQPDYKEAKKWLVKASNSKDKKFVLYADNILGLMYFNGDGVLQDYKKAEVYFKKAIKNKITVAKCNLGNLYIKEGKIKLAKRYLREGYQDGEEYCAEIWNKNGLGR
ncbi:tetratricopeptide repeat protein [Nitrosophilus kaiyonis]|uniref:tetratricopeptide repeat protein n=1 Tax=Nitrosophilus kaiyonis TaxID=2930200 RepID=UPI0024931891|nr:tetratricopeptide repeat protein [Nitrosophilus kaiyonis]